MKMFHSHKKNDSHLLLVNYGDDQSTLLFQDKGNNVTYTPLESFSLQSVSPILIKFKKPTRTKVKTFIQQNPLLNETDCMKMMILLLQNNFQQNSQSLQLTQNTHTLHCEIQ